ncbi:MAG: VanZ family protein [bacterium]
MILFVIFVIYLFYATLYPFNFSFQEDNILYNLNRINIIPFSCWGGREISWSDVVSNLLLFIPYGFLLNWELQNRNIGKLKSKLICIISAFLLSSTLEFLQLFSLRRRTGITDIVNNTIGSWIGCVLSNDFLVSFKDKLFHQINLLRRENPLLVYLGLYSLLIMLVFIYPFDISIARENIYYAIKNFNLTPFYYRGHLNISFSENGINIILFIIFGFLVYVSLRKYYSKILTLFITIFIGFCLATLIEFTQIIIPTRVPDITDIIFYVMGTLLGDLLAFITLYKK